MPADSRRVKDLFAAALDLPDPHARQAYLDRECGADADLRRWLDMLLTALDRPTSAPAEPPADGTSPFVPDAGASVADAAAPGAVIAGRYKLLEPIGEGGMGSVWLAEQREPVKRLVAVKLIKPGLDSRAVLARFEAERQALALMDHPHIAKVFDGGTTDRGRPFFVMELVQGVPLTEYCDARRLSVPDRLAVFGQICAAVQHAHQKGVIHRDLKPGNILVADHDGRPVPKVIDFGLAKAVAAGGRLTDHTLHTGFGTAVGTPLYMAPEQVEANAVDVDTRADVYALGVILYELLTGSTPLERRRVREAVWDEVRRLIREEEPPKPSLRLSTSDALPSLAANRQTEPARLSRLVRGDLDWIVLKALEKDRNRRYATANGLARDLERYLADEPVEACPPSAGYRLRKFVRRNKGRVLAAGLVAAALLAGAGVATWQAVRATRAEARAVAAAAAAERAADAERAASDQARKRLAQVETTNAILGSVFTDLNPRAAEHAGKPLQAVLGERLDRATAELEGEAVGDPLAVARMQRTLADSQLGLGYPAKAIALYQKARATFAARLGADHADTLASTNGLAAGYVKAGQYDRALPLHEETLQRRTAALGPDHADTLTSLGNLASNYHAVGKLAAALPLYERVFHLQKSALGPDHQRTLVSMHHLAVAYRAAGQFDRAAALHEEAHRLAQARFGPDHADTLLSLNGLAQDYQAAGKLDRALPLLEEALRRRTATLGPDHPDTLTSMNNLAGGYYDVDQFDRAVPLYEVALKLQTAKLGPDHPFTLTCLANLANAYRYAGKLDRAVPLYEQAIAGQTAKLGPDHPDTLTTMSGLADAYRVAGRLDAAVPQSEATVRLMKARYGPDHASTLNAVAGLAIAYRAAGKHGPNEALLRDLVAAYQRTAGAESPLATHYLTILGENLLGQQKFAEAEPVFREALAVRTAKEPDGWATFYTQSRLGEALVGRQQYAAAEPLLRTGYVGLKRRAEKAPAEAARLPDAAGRLVRLYEAWGKPAETAQWRAERAAVLWAIADTPPDKK